MNRKQAERFAWLCRALETHGLSMAEIDRLLKCERTLGRWATRECGDGSNWGIERDEVTDKPFNVYHGLGASHRYPIADRETAAMKRAEAICAAHGLTAYHQGDPRGCALYVLRPGDVPEGQCVTGCYSRGIAVCID